MTKRISYSLWGMNQKYTIGAIRNAEIAAKYWKDWKCVFYVANDVPSIIIDRLKELDCDIINMQDAGWNGMFWRFLAADSFDIVISRDTDSRLGEREKFAVDAWLDSDKDFHIMRDHPYHNTEILGGMWGAKNGILRGIKHWIKNYDKRDFDNQWQVDQNFLREIVYPIVKDRSLVHDEFFERKSFPKESPKRNKMNFVGQVFDIIDNPVFDP